MTCGSSAEPSDGPIRGSIKGPARPDCRSLKRSPWRCLQFARDAGTKTQGRQSMVQIHEQRTIAAPPEQVFDWLLDPANLTVSPWFRKASWLEGPPDRPGVGATRQLKGIGFWVHEQLTAYDPPRSCSYRVTAGFPPARQDGTLTCHAIRRRNTCRLEERLYPSRARRRQAPCGTDRATTPCICFPSNSHRLRKGIGNVIRQRNTCHPRKAGNLPLGHPGQGRLSS